jgi:hypothetical protein
MTVLVERLKLLLLLKLVLKVSVELKVLPVLVGRYSPDDCNWERT